jgi:hypothetical protein
VEGADYENAVAISASHFTIRFCCTICKGCIRSLATAWLLSPKDYSNQTGYRKVGTCQVKEQLDINE